jgi:Glycosyltransferase family 87
MNSIDASQLGRSLRDLVATIPGVQRVRSLGLSDRRSVRGIGGPLPVVMVGALVAIDQAVTHAWVALDASLYWQASARLDNLYDPNWTSAYNYASPPPVAQLWAPLHLLPFGVVQAVWITFLFGCLWYAARAWALPIIVIGAIGFALGIPAMAAPLDIILLGNVGMLMTAGIVASLRRPEAIAIPALTKVGPAVALFWHVLRRDRRAVLGGVAAITIAFGISFALNPASWIEWLNWIVRNYGLSPLEELAIPFVIRAPIGIAIVALAARTNRAWLVPIGAGLCIPADYGYSFLTVWVGALGLVGQRSGSTSS